MTSRASNALLVVAVLFALAAPLSAQRGKAIRINLGTIVPKDSAWHEALLRMREDWREISGGRIDLRIYSGGALGDDAEMLRKVRIGQLQAVAVTALGLAKIDPAIDALHLPMLFESYQELDYVRDRMAPTYEKRLAEKGYVVLNWSDGGWAHFFTAKPAKTLADIRSQKLWISAGDPKTERLYKDYRMRVVPLAVTDLATSFETGLIEAVTLPPLFAMLNGSFERAPYMTDVKWAPIVGGTVVSSKAWESIPSDLRPRLLEASQRAGAQVRERIRRLGDDAVDQMKQRGLTVVAADHAAWLAEVKAAYPELRGVLAPAELFDEAIRLRDEFRKK